jgi:hypothetical protein
MTNNIETMAQIYNHLNSTTADFTIIYLSYTNDTYATALSAIIEKQYLEIKAANPSYNYTYEYLIIYDKPQINTFFVNNIASTLPYLLSYKKKYVNRTPWWTPCKKLEIDIRVPQNVLYGFISYSLSI